MKKLSILISICFLVFRCQTDPKPDYTGKYHGIRSESLIYANYVPQNGEEKRIDTLEISIIKDTNGYLIRGFDTVDIPINLSNLTDFVAAPYSIDNDVNSVTGSFEQNSITIAGNWKFVYSESEYTDTSKIRSNYTFVGAKVFE
ncbi:hypothetical protein [Dyadobacter sp. CY356]|uniref:hypothetical protein n=1 Tax=Dyadobacter sp. CY356 TaxID=2906442 RepID=UPI001F42BA3A|nr:hypothetical protein [Dyadobacter sp. CY356]MCF0055100.1 hypothetical protein [Dyadobacter sp. CY356]